MNNLDKHQLKEYVRDHTLSITQACMYHAITSMNEYDRMLWINNVQVALINDKKRG